MCYLLPLPFLFFWVLLIVGRRELGWRWVAGLVLVWSGCLIGAVRWTGQSAGYVFVAAQGLLVIIMAFKIFGPNIPRSR